MLSLTHTHTHTRTHTTKTGPPFPSRVTSESIAMVHVLATTGAAFADASELCKNSIVSNQNMLRFQHTNTHTHTHTHTHTRNN